MHIPTMTRGDKTPDLVINIGDTRESANFTPLVAGDVRVLIERGGKLVVDAVATSITPAADGKSATVRRTWVEGETDVVGRHWVSVYVVPWDQTFPDEGPLRLDIARAAGDA